MRIVTLCLLADERRILLGMKKRGFGAGKWNGFGGEALDGEMVTSAAIREVREEVGMEVEESQLQRVGQILFRFGGQPKLVAHVFLAGAWRGEPVESEEMRPQWFKRSEIPFDRMWLADREWLPLVLAGKRISAEVFYSADGDSLEEFTWREVVFSA